jgi:hypothetical protein
MKTNDILSLAVDKDIINHDQQNKLQLLFTQNAGFNFANLWYYFGGFLAITAVTIFMSLSYDAFKETGVLILSISLFIVGLLLSKKYAEHPVPAGIFATFSICLVPLITYCIQVLTGLMHTDYDEYHRYIRWNWIAIELTTLIVASVMLYIRRFPFMVFPVAITIWYLSMDFAMLFTDHSYSNFEFRRQISVVFGIITLFLALYVDTRSQRSQDYSYWLYIIGTICFWFGMTMSHSDSQLDKFFYFCINFSMMTVGVLLARRVLTVFGAAGALIYTGQLSRTVFHDDLLFSLVLIALGFCFIRLGMWWSKNNQRISETLQSRLSDKTRAFLTRVHD